jgi:hypothetical protein
MLWALVAGGDRVALTRAKMVAVKILVKSLIVWVLLLAVPFQGFASATMLLCAPMQSRDLVTLTGAASSQHHEHNSILAGQYAEMDCQVPNADATTPHGGDHYSTGVHHDSSNCNACATCCFGTSMPPSVLVAFEAQPIAVIPFDTGFIPAVALALPERPPQASLA